jgi:hypothetical protein
MSWLTKALGAGVLALSANTAVWAEDIEEPAVEKPAVEKPAAKATAEDIAGWIKQLDADRFSERQAASEKLFAEGKTVIPDLTKAAITGTLEATVRSIDLLQRFYDSEDKSIKEAAKESLEKIVQSDNENAIRRAKKVLNPKEDQQPQAAPNPMNPFGGMFPGGGQAKNVIMSNVNGVTTIKVVEGDKKTTIGKRPDGSIEVEITDKVDDKNITKKYKAKNAEELKKKSPEAYDAYKENGENNGMAGMAVNLGLPNGGGGMVGGQGMPGMMPFNGNAMPGMPGMGAAGAGNGSDDLGESLKKWNESIKTLDADLEPEKLSPEDKKEMKAQIDELKKQLDKLERRLQKPAKPGK